MVQKQVLSNLISKYYLNGEIKSSKWKCSDGCINAKFLKNRYGKNHIRNRLSIDYETLVIDDFDKLEHIGSMFTVRTVLAHRDHDDARPTIVTQEAHNVYTIFSGKIGTCVPAANELVRRLQPKYRLAA